MSKEKQSFFTKHESERLKNNVVLLVKLAIVWVVLTAFIMLVSSLAK